MRISLSEELRSLEYSQRLRDKARAIYAQENRSTGRVFYDAALRGGAQALQRQSGSIAVGEIADLMALDATSSSFIAVEKGSWLDAWIFANDDRREWGELRASVARASVACASGRDSCSDGDLHTQQRLLYLRTLHLADGRPYLYEERWVNPAVVPELVDLDLTEISINEWLVSNAPFVHGDISWGACNADELLATQLQCELGQALLETERSTWGADGVITTVRLVNAPQHRLRSKL